MKNVKIEPRMPKAEGMKVLGAGEFPMKNIISTKDGDNYARLRGTSESKCQAFATIIRNGNYEPQYHIPPVGVKENGKIRLITGNHRYRGHELAGATMMYVAIVEFFPTAGMSAEYFEAQYQSNENKGDDVVIKQLTRTDEDIVSITKSMITRNIINDSDSDIQRALEDQGFGKKSDRGKNLLNMVKASIGKTTGVTKLYTRGEAIKYMSERYDITKTDVMTRTMKDSTGHDKDYDPRMMDKIADHVKKSDRPLTVGIYFNGLTPDEILETRRVKRNVIKTQVEKAREIVKLADAGEFDKVSLRFLPQIDTDYADVA